MPDINKAIPVAIASKDMKEMVGERPTNEQDFISKNAIGRCKIAQETKDADDQDSRTK